MDPDRFTQDLKAEADEARREGKKRGAADARERQRREFTARADAAAKLEAFAVRTAGIARAIEERTDAYVFWVLGELELHRGGPGARRRGIFGMKARGFDRWEPSKTEMAGWVIDRRQYRGTRRSGTGWSTDPEEYTGVAALVLLADGRMATGEAPQADVDQQVVAPRSGEELLDNELWNPHVEGAMRAFGKRYGLAF